MKNFIKITALVIAFNCIDSQGMNPEQLSNVNQMRSFVLDEVAQPVNVESADRQAMLERMSSMRNQLRSFVLDEVAQPVNVESADRQAMLDMLKRMSSMRNQPLNIKRVDKQAILDSMEQALAYSSEEEDEIDQTVNVTTDDSREELDLSENDQDPGEIDQIPDYRDYHPMVLHEVAQPVNVESANRQAILERMSSMRNQPKHC